MRMGVLMTVLGWLAMEALTVVPSFAKLQEIATESKDSSGSSSKEQPASDREEGPVRKNDSDDLMLTRPHGLKSLGGQFLQDQKQIWTSPSHLRLSDADWLIPVGGLTAGLLVTDSDYSKTLSQNPSTISHYKTLSTAGVAALVGSAGG